MMIHIPILTEKTPSETEELIGVVEKQERTVMLNCRESDFECFWYTGDDDDYINFYIGGNLFLCPDISFIDVFEKILKK